MRRAAPPHSEAELLQRVDGLAGRTLGEVAGALHTPVPADLSRNKGWIGQVLEAVLGANAGSRPVPDFEALGVELKTLPVDASGRVRESTFVSTAAMDGSLAHRWEESRVFHKLSAVLWVPIVGQGAPGERLVGSGFLWRMTADEEAVLKRDWEELAGLLHLGEHWQIDARRGEALQLRPKAAHSDDLTWTLGPEGDWVRAGPVGFYLRASFTGGLLRSRFR